MMSNAFFRSVTSFDRYRQKCVLEIVVPEMQSR
jgi:hypothetical protein